MHSATVIQIRLEETSNEPKPPVRMDTRCHAANILTVRQSRVV